MFSARNSPQLSRFLVVSAVGGALFVAGCSSASGNSPDAGSVGEQGQGDSGSVACTGGETYAANMTAPGTLGAYTFTLVASTPAPPAQYGNTWTLKVADSTGAAPSASQLTVYPFMPLMGHGSDQVPTVAANADGSFTVTDVYLFMPGLWTVTISVLKASGADASAPTGAPVTLDKAVYSFCID